METQTEMPVPIIKSIAFNFTEVQKPEASALNTLFQIIKGDGHDEDNDVSPETPVNKIRQQKSCTLPPFVQALKKYDGFTLTFDEKKKTLVLDLDETLLHSHRYYPGVPSIVVPIKSRGMITLYYVIKRPGVDEFLESLIEHYNICIYTSSEDEYAIGIMEALSIKKYFFGLYSRRHCHKVSDHMYVKNLSKIGFPEHATVFVDDFPLQLKNQPNNGLIIKRFYSDEKDQELKRLLPFLKHLAKLDNVTPVAKHLFEFFIEERKLKKEARVPFLTMDSTESSDRETTCDTVALRKAHSGSHTDRMVLSAEKKPKIAIPFTPALTGSKSTISPTAQVVKSLEDSLSDKQQPKKSQFFMITQKPSIEKLNPKH